VPRGTLFHVAVLNNKPDAVDILINLGADPNLKSGVLPRPLHYAADVGSDDMIVKLLQVGLQPDVIDHMQGTP